MKLLHNYTPSNEYLAGFIDGEGCIAMYKVKDKRNKREYTAFPVILIANTNYNIINEINKIVKGKITKQKREYPWKDSYLLYIHGHNNILVVLNEIEPYLIVKKEQAKLLLEFCNHRLRNGKITTQIYSSRDIEIINKFKTINRRGKL